MSQQLLWQLSKEHTESYRQIAKLSALTDCLTVGQNWKNDARLVFVIQLPARKILDDFLIHAIKNNIRIALSPRHVPTKILPVKAIPKTLSGKTVTLTVSNKPKNLSRPLATVRHGLPRKY